MRAGSSSCQNRTAKRPENGNLQMGCLLARVAQMDDEGLRLSESGHVAGHVV